MLQLRDDPLPDPLTVQANWQALSLFGREKADNGPTRITLHDFPLSRRSVALLYAEPLWLMTLLATPAPV